MKYLNVVLIILLFPVAAFAVPLPITGNTGVCLSSTMSLSDATLGGVWSSSTTTVATISSTGIVTGVSAGTSTITYDIGGSFVTTIVTVSNISPVLTSTLTPTSLCDSAIFNYTPVSSLPGTTFAWIRAVTPGIANPADTGSGNPNEQLINTTYVPVSVPFVYILTAGGCADTETVSVIVNPTPALSSGLSAHVCSGTTFAYIPTSFTPGTTFAWTRPAVANISPSTMFGTSSISETLINATLTPITVAYLFRLTANGCITGGVQSLLVDVSPCDAAVPQVNAAETKIYPNPGNGTFTVYFSSTDNERVALAITNVVGETVKELVVGTNTSTEIKLGVSPGVYFLSAVSERSRYYAKVVVER